MSVVEMLARGTAEEPMFRGQRRDIKGKFNARAVEPAMTYSHTSGAASPLKVEIINRICGHAVLIPITKSTIRERRWPADVRKSRDLDTVCANCHRTAKAAFEVGRQETMVYLGSDQCVSLLEAVEYATEDPDLRVALYQRVSQWRGCPMAVDPKHLAFLERRAMRIVPIRGNPSPST